MTELVKYIEIVLQTDSVAVMQLLDPNASDAAIEAEIERTTAAWADFPEWLPVKSWRHMNAVEIVNYRARRKSGGT
jgi:hypothetical protein